MVCFISLKTSLNVTLPTVAAALKWLQDPIILEMWFGCLDRVAKHDSNTVLVDMGLVYCLSVYLE
jgi:hypothetical protein